jgi:hypothetical protein
MPRRRNARSAAPSPNANAAPLRYESRWICSPGEPLATPPVGLGEMTC